MDGVHLVDHNNLAKGTCLRGWEESDIICAVLDGVCGALDCFAIVVRGVGKHGDFVRFISIITGMV